MTKAIKIKPLARACAFILATGSLVSVSNAIAKPTPAGTTISNKVVVTYQDANGKQFTDESNVIEMTIREVRTATLTGSNADQDVSNTTKKITSIHKLTNMGNIDEVYQLNASNKDDDSIDATNIVVYLDKDGNGKLSDEELKAGPITSISLVMGESANLIMVADLPEVIEDGATLHLMLNVKDSKGNGVKTPNHVMVKFGDGTKAPEGEVTIWKGTPAANCHAYTVVKGGFTHPQALAEAKKLKYQGKLGHLVTITSVEEDAFVTKYQKDNSLGWTWLGLTKINQNWSWNTGETFAYKNFRTGHENRDAKYIVSLKNPAWNAGQWIDYPVDTTKRQVIVEFDTPCGDVAKPEVSVALTAAKDALCDGKADGTFGDVNMVDMASGECVIMHMRAENTKDVVGEKVAFKQMIPEYASYVPNTINVCGWDDACTLTSRTDGIDNDTGKADWAHYDTQTAAVVIGGYWKDKPAQMVKGVIHAEYRLKID